MKIRYLPQEDRQNLHMLRHTTDPDVIAAVLASIFKRPYYTLQALWEYRKWFLGLSEWQLKKNPALVCGLAQIRLMEGDPEEARRLIDSLPEDSIHRAASTVVFPGSDMEEKLACVRRIRDSGIQLQGLTLTAGRPTVRNGVWDMTPYAAIMEEDKEAVLEAIRLFFPDSAQQVYDLAMAEAMYQRDDCYNALVATVGLIPQLKEAQDMRLLFAALTLEIYILVINDQARVAAPLIANLREQIAHNNMEGYLPNIAALEAWAAMYDGDYVQVAKWLQDGAPDEYGRFCMLDLFRYMIKLRAYIIQGKHLAVTALAQRLMPLLEAGHRHMDICELCMLWSMSDHAAGRNEEALEHMGKALELAEKYRYDRLLADEGKRLLDVLRLYQKTRGRSPYTDRIRELATKAATLHPGYLKSQLPEQPALTETEMRVLRLLSASFTNAEIASMTDTAVDTVKQHCKHICAKLQTKNRHQAVSRAVELGLIRPVQPGSQATLQ